MHQVSRFGLFALVVCALVAFAPPAAADHHEGDDAYDATATIEANILDFYEKWNAGKAAEAFSHVMIGGRGFLGDGGLLVGPLTEESHAKVAARYQAMFDAGLSLDFSPKHIEVSAGAEGAVATFYLHGSVTPPGGAPEGVMARATLVWLKMDDEWKMFHWHISKIEAPE